MNLLKLLLLTFVLSASAKQKRDKAGKGSKGTKGSKGGKGNNVRSKNDRDDRVGKPRTLTLNVVNEAFDQPFGPFFVMVHNSDAEPLYVRGRPASDPLATLAENGSPAELLDYYAANDEGVKSAEAFTEGVPFLLGDEVAIEVEVSKKYPLVTIASMAINTNDCFVSLNGVEVYDGQAIDVPGLDAGSEENNEDCASIPGPGCPGDSGNERSGNGEGFVHVHRGLFGVGDLERDRYDWRNPMMRVDVTG